MTAHNIEITEFIKILKELKTKGYTAVDLEIKDDLVLSVKGIENSKTDKKISDGLNWEDTI